MRDERRDAVVVAEADLVARERVVLVDDRHAAQLEQPLHGAARVQVLLAVGEVVWHDEDLRRDQAVARERLVVVGHEAALARGGERLERGRIRGPRVEA